MAGRESSWALAPARNLDVLPREEATDYDAMDMPTFQPELMSNPELREKARSSNYGRATATMARVVLSDNDLRPWQEEPTFRPELPADAKREAARGSGYGKVIPTTPVKEAPLPPFQPQISRPKSAQKLMQSVKSSSYGHVVAQASRPQSAPTPSFRPEIPPSKLRESVKSSDYGKQVPAVRRRSDARSSPKATYVPRYTLLQDKPEPNMRDESDPRESGFVLDCVGATSAKTKFDVAFPPSPRHKAAAKQKELREKAASSAYGVASPAVAPRQERPVSAPSFSLPKANSVLEKPLDPFPPKTPLADKASPSAFSRSHVRSSAYGVEPPPVAPKPEPKEAEPKWTPHAKGSVPAELPPPPKSDLNSKVQSAGYGKTLPPKGPRFEIAPQPLWLPSNSPRVTLGPAPPVPRSKLTDQVRSHYGSEYDPVALYAFNGDAEFDTDGGHVNMMDGVDVSGQVEEDGDFQAY